MFYTQLRDNIAHPYIVYMTSKVAVSELRSASLSYSPSVRTRGITLKGTEYHRKQGS